MLSKATNVDIELEQPPQRERTPYRCLEELYLKMSQDMEADLWKLYDLILKKWIRRDVQKASGDPYRLNGRTFLNPKTGAHLTVKEYGIIKDELAKIFGKLYADSAESVIKQSMAMGKVLQSMEPADRLTVGLADLPLKAVSFDDQFRHVVDYATLHTGELIQDVTERSRKAISNVIMQGYQERISTEELEDRLFDAFDVMNRDWRRIAETETATNFNNGYLMSEIKNNINNEHLFVQGISGGGACPFCRSHVDGKVFALLSGPPSEGGDVVDVEGEAFTAIWPGKTNYGRKRVDWWVASGTQHPHCQCSFVAVGDVTSDFEKKMKAIMDSERRLRTAPAP